MEYGSATPFSGEYSPFMRELLIEQVKRTSAHGTVQVRSNDSFICWVVNPQQHRIEEFPVLLDEFEL